MITLTVLLVPQALGIRPERRGKRDAGEGLEGVGGDSGADSAGGVAEYLSRNKSFCG